jgi:hypothetical protein
LNRYVAISGFLLHGIAWALAGLSSIHVTQGSTTPPFVFAVAWLSGFGFLGWFWSRTIEPTPAAAIRRSITSWACIIAGLVLLISLRLGH